MILSLNVRTQPITASRDCGRLETYLMKRQLHQIHKVLLQVTCLQPGGALVYVFLVGVWQLKLNTCAQVMTSCTDGAAV